MEKDNKSVKIKIITRMKEPKMNVKGASIWQYVVFEERNTFSNCRMIYMGLIMCYIIN